MHSISKVYEKKCDCPRHSHYRGTFLQIFDCPRGLGKDITRQWPHFKSPKQGLCCMKQIPACASVLNITYSLMHWQRGGSQWDCRNQTQLPLICMHSPLTSLIIQLKIYILLMNYKNIYLPFHTTNTNEHHKRNTDTNYFRLSVLFFTNIIFKNEHVHLFTEMGQSIPNLWQLSLGPRPLPLPFFLPLVQSDWMHFFKLAHLEFHQYSERQPWLFQSTAL